MRTGAGVVTGASSVAREDGRWVARKSVLAGSWDTACAATGPLAVVALAPHAVRAEPLARPRRRARSWSTSCQASAAARAVTVVSRAHRPAGDRPALAEAEVVVVGGRGVDGDFSGVEELADVLGAAVGATRVATDEGWIGHEAQVGQTGVTISPAPLRRRRRLRRRPPPRGDGRRRHGRRRSTTTPTPRSSSSPTTAIVGDLTEVLPALTAALRARR